MVRAGGSAGPLGIQVLLRWIEERPAGMAVSGGTRDWSRLGFGS